MAHQSNLIESDIEHYLLSHENKSMLRFITCGSVDDGKSTLIGRLLHDSKMIFEDQLLAIEKDSKKCGTTGEKIDLALLVDGLVSEREQGITIDVAYRYFSTDKKKYIIADTPGHEQYTRNMVTGASTADLAIILVDASKGILTQTKRHSYIVSLLGINQIVVAINKMDLVSYSKERFEEIKRAYKSEILEKMPQTHSQLNIEFLPISALEGDNVVEKSENMEWYRGNTLLGYLDNLELDRKSGRSDSLRFAVQYVNRPNSSFRGYCGVVASGKIRVGDEITVLPSGFSTKVKSIIPPQLPTKDGDMELLNEAFEDMSVTITTVDELDIGRGDMIVKSDDIPRVSNTLKVMVVWMGEKKMQCTENYLIKIATTVTNGFFEHINYKFDVNSYEKLKTNELSLNDIASCKLVLSRSVVADIYSKHRNTGGFIVIDKTTNGTVGAGMIVDVARREYENVHNIPRAYTKAEIELNEYIRKNYPEWECKAI